MFGPEIRRKEHVGARAKKFLDVWVQVGAGLG